MMTTRCCSQLLGIFLLSITLLSLGLGSETCDQDKCKPYVRCENHDYCLWNFSNGHCFSCMECSNKDCEEQSCKADTCVLKCSGCERQKCEGEVKECKMHLGCNGRDCQQTCQAKNKCEMNCSLGGCKIQKCEGGVKECKMDLGCNGRDCQQTCKAKNKCEMNCSWGGCKIQKCEGGVKECKMHLKCNGKDCRQTCKAKTCNMECSGGGCKEQTCDTGNVCNMRCNADNCAQTCKATACRMTRTWPINSQDKLVCSGNGECCGSFMSSYDTSPLSTVLYQSCEKQNSCTCTKYANNIYSTSNLYTSNIVTSTGIPLFATKTSAGQGTEACTLRQSSSQSPLSIISPLPLPSPSSHSSLAAEASSSPASKYLLLSKLATAISEAASSATVLSVSSSSLSLSAPSASASSPVAAAETSAVSSSLIPSPSSSLLLVMMTTAASLSTSPSPRTSSSTLAAIKNLVNKYFSELDGIEISGISSMMEAIRVFENFITSIQTISKRKEEIEMTRKSIFNAAVALEEFALNFGKYHLTDTNSSVKIDSQKLVLAIQKAYSQNAGDFYLGKKGLPASMKLSSANFANNVSVVAGILHKDLHEVLFIDQPFTITKGNTRYLDSGIMAVAMDPRPEKLQENVILKFRNLNVHEGKRKCMFWSSLTESSGEFSEKRCYVVASESNSEETVCSCDHLTHFAVLVDYNGSPGLTEEDETILEIITYVGLSLSILGLFLTIILYSFLTDIWQPLSQIRLSLSVALGTGQIIFLAGINATENTASCITAAAFLQYFLMAAFCWMLVEGIYFYLLLVKVYNINTKMHMYHVISWGLPIIMVVISLSIASGKDGIQSFTSEKYCWLSSTNNLIWIFVTFVAFIEVLNILIIARVVKEMSTLIQPTGRDNHMQQIRLGIKTCAVMIPLLGVTWVFGLLLPLHKAFAYIFTIFNSTQGILIFLLHCVRNSQIRERLKRKMSIVCPSAADQGNSVKKTSQVNPSSVGNVWAVKMQSFKE